ncbi:981_t:CDS:2 [Entrophospora sp. SA101]|nr:981_t:CDS:2 [Entrophospora sp. SA101]
MALLLLDQQQQSNTPNYLTSYRRSSSASNIYFLAKTNQNQLLGINSPTSTITT